MFSESSALTQANLILGLAFGANFNFLGGGSTTNGHNGNGAFWSASTYSAAHLVSRLYLCPFSVALE